MVFTAHFGFSVRLPDLSSHEKHWKFCEYDTEKFAGLFYKKEEEGSKGVKQVLFPNGTVNILGAKSEE